MAETDLRRVLRRLTESAAHFERVAAHHKRIETERKALQEAITEAQLVLSVAEHSGRKRKSRMEGRESAGERGSRERQRKAEKKEPLVGRSPATRLQLLHGLQRLLFYQTHGACLVTHRMDS